MKYALLFVGLILFGFNAGAQDKIKWHTIEEAIQLASQEPRVIVIDVYTDWCGWCKRMDATTFSDSEVVEFMNKQFYPVKLNAQGKVLEAAPGYKTADQFIVYLAYYSDGAYKSQAFDVFSARYAAEEKSVIESL